jgi:capsular polysaccharide biosynthesis protein
MWICFNDGFVSAVENYFDKTQLVVRARKYQHLENVFPDVEISTDYDADYRYRVFVSKEVFAATVAKRILEIDYNNFKNSVEDGKLHDLYADFWHLHYQYQGHK